MKGQKEGVGRQDGHGHPMWVLPGTALPWRWLPGTRSTQACLRTGGTRTPQSFIQMVSCRPSRESCLHGIWQRARERECPRW